jgi:hypothetical protein
MPSSDIVVLMLVAVSIGWVAAAAIRSNRSDS